MSKYINVGFKKVLLSQLAILGLVSSFVFPITLALLPTASHAAAPIVTSYDDSSNTPAQCDQITTLCTGSKDVVSSFTDTYDPDTGTHKGGVQYHMYDDAHSWNSGVMGQTCDYTVSEEQISGFVLKDTSGNVIATVNTPGVSSVQTSWPSFTWSGVSGGEVASITVLYSGWKTDKINDGTGGCYDSTNYYRGSFDKTPTVTTSPVPVIPPSSSVTNGPCGVTTQSITSNIGQGNTNNGGPINVTFKVTSAQITNNVLNMHYEVYLDKQTPSFKVGFNVVQGSTQSSPGTVVITQDYKQTVVAANNITTPVIQGDVSGPVDGSNTNFRIDWNWLYTFTYNTKVGQQSSEVPGGSSFNMTACPPAVPEDYHLTGSLPQIIVRGDTAVFTISATNCVGGFNGPITNLRVEEGLPQGVGPVSFTSNTINSCDPGNNSTQLIIKTTASTRLGLYNHIVVAGDAAPGTRVTDQDLSLWIIRSSIASVSLAPKDADVLVGSTLSYKFIGKLSDGSTVDLSNSALSSFVSTDSSKASMSGNIATGKKVGDVTITASYFINDPQHTDTATLHVVDFGITCAPMSQTLYQGQNSSVVMTAVSTNGFKDDIPVVVNANGLNVNPAFATLSFPKYTQPFTISGNAGDYTLNLTASYNGDSGIKTANCVIPVHILPNLTGLSITPTPWSIPVNGNVDYAVSASYSSGPSKTVTSLSSFKSNNPAIATVSGNRATGASVGGTQIVATYSENGVTVNAPADLTVAGAGSVPNTPTTVSLDNSSCGKISVSWTPDNSGTSADGYRVYRATAAPRVYNWQLVSGNLPVGQTSFVDPNPYFTSGLNYYAVTAYNSSGESAKTISSGIGVFTCGPDLSKSDKDIIQVANSTIASSPCNGFDFVSIPSTIKPGTSLGFAINICNTGVSATKDITPGTNITVDDQLQNIIGVDPKAITCTKANGTKCNVSNVKITGAAPNERINFKVEHGGITIGSYVTIKFTGKIADVVNKTPLYKFRNVADIYLDGDKKKTVQTPPFLYVNGSFVPEKQEISP